MGYKYSFVDNAEYGATDVNDAIKKLVSAGVEDPFTDGLPYNASKLNGIIQAVASDGVVPESNATLKCSISADEENTVLVNPGTAFFANGSTITIDLEGEKLSYTPGVINYVYLFASPAENRNYPVCSTVAPSGDYVLLAEISEKGALTDKRKYAKGKLPGYCNERNTTLHYRKALELKKGSRGQYILPDDVVIDLGEGHNFAFLCQVPFNQGGSPTNYGGGLYDLKNKAGVFGYLNNGIRYSRTMYLCISKTPYTYDDIYSNRLNVKIAVDNNQLRLSFPDYKYTWSSEPPVIYATLEFYLFSEGAQMQ